jgi:hypothetical protein
MSWSREHGTNRHLNPKEEKIEIREALKRSTRRKSSAPIMAYKAIRSDTSPSPTRELEWPEETNKEPATEEDREERTRILEALRTAKNLPSLFAVLKVANEFISTEKRRQLSAYEQRLLRDATVAIPYLMYKETVEHLTRPLSFGVLAFSVAKAKQISEQLFKSIGPACCFQYMTESTITREGHLTKNEAQKVLPILKQVGLEASSKEESIRRKILGCEKDEK